MAANTNKRIPVKWIRDGAKAAYDKQDHCFICGRREELELHHTHGMTNLLEKWAKDNGVSLSTDEKVLAIREEFIELHHKEIYEDVFTLCVGHHEKLHSVFGKSPPLSTATKQTRWVHIQKEKHENKLESNELGDVSKSKPSSISNGTSGGVFGRLVLQHDYFASFRKD